MKIVLQASMAEVSITYENCSAVQFSLLKGLYGSSLVLHMRIVLQAFMADVFNHMRIVLLCNSSSL